MTKKKRNQGVEILAIGTELLLGNILNSNAKWLAEQLALIGLSHYRQTVVGDNIERLREIVLEASQRSHILITTGGLGPTTDDLTTETIAQAFKADLVEHKTISQDIKNKLSNLDIFPESNLKQSLLPEGATILPNPLGTAPGMIWSPEDNFTIITFPGVPSEMKTMWEKTAKPWILENHSSGKIIKSKTIKIAGIPESALTERISDLISKTNPTLAPYASLGEVKLRITAQAKTAQEANKLIQPIESELEKRIGLSIFGRDEESLASIVIDLLRKRRETISLAESCTGGQIASALTSIPGSSDVFLGGVVAYSNSIKQNILKVPLNLLEEHGAVSSAVAKSMANKTRQLFNSDWSIAVSGIAGPSGGSKSKPVGLVEIFISGNTAQESIQENFGPHRGRDCIQKLSVVRALDRLRLFLLMQS